jgi:RAMP superfamily
MTTKILYLFTRTPLHVGAGASVGAIDQPVQRERHTGFPVIPASSLKGSFADQWNDGLVANTDKDGNTKKVRVNKNGEIAEAAWLFGSDNDNPAFAGSLIFSEARLLAFPIRSAKGSYAWITCPLMLQRVARDGVISGKIPNEPRDHEASFKLDGPLALGNQIVLEEYCFTHNGSYPDELAKAIADLVTTVRGIRCCGIAGEKNPLARRAMERWGLAWGISAIMGLWTLVVLVTYIPRGLLRAGCNGPPPPWDFLLPGANGMWRG